MKVMKHFILVIFAIITIISFSQPTSGNGASNQDLQLNTITSALPFLAITPDSRAGAMGDAGTALSASSSSLTDS